MLVQGLVRAGGCEVRCWREVADGWDWWGGVCGLRAPRGLNQAGVRAGGILWSVRGTSLLRLTGLWSEPLAGQEVRLVIDDVHGTCCRRACSCGDEAKSQ